MSNPFEQFQSFFFSIISYNYGSIVNMLNYSINITNISVYLILCFFIIISLLHLSTKSNYLINDHYGVIVEILYLFILDLLTVQTGPKARKYFPAIFSIFILILILNLLGLTPFGFTVTSQIIITASLSIGFFGAWIIIGIKNLKYDFIKIFIPKGIPPLLLPILIVIEIISFAIRPLSLAIRLFANMLAGHILLFIIATAALALAKSFILLGLLPFFFVLVFLFLELGIAFLQAYVFTILLCIYLHDSFHVH